MSDRPIAGRLAVQLGPVTVKPPAAPHTYFGVARAMMPGVQLLAATPHVSPHALALVAAHVLECLLKAYLSRGGSDAGLRDPNVRHNLEALWSMAAADGLRITTPPPQWVQRLSGVYDKPYTLRYSTGVHGIVLPPLDVMAAELDNLFEVVGSKLV